MPVILGFVEVAAEASLDCHLRVWGCRCGLERRMGRALLEAIVLGVHAVQRLNTHRAAAADDMARIPFATGWLR